MTKVKVSIEPDKDYLSQKINNYIDSSEVKIVIERTKEKDLLIFNIDLEIIEKKKLLEALINNDISYLLEINNATKIKPDKELIKEITTEINNILHNLGISTDIQGFTYIREAVMLIYQSNIIIKNIKDIYQKIAIKHSTTIDSVESNIRYAIEKGWARSKWDYSNRLFGNSLDFDKAKPTNTEYLMTVADVIKNKYGRYSVF